MVYRCCVAFALVGYLLPGHSRRLFCQHFCHPAYRFTRDQTAERSCIEGVHGHRRRYNNFTVTDTFLTKRHWVVEIKVSQEMGQRHTSVNSQYGARESDDRRGSGEGDGLLHNGDAGDGQDGHISSGDRSSASSENGVQEGVLKIEAISRIWTRRSLLVAYLGYV